MRLCFDLRKKKKKNAGSGGPLKKREFSVMGSKGHGLSIVTSGF